MTEPKAGRYRVCRGCGVQERTLEGVSNLFPFVDFCKTCVAQAAAELRREERRRWLDRVAPR